MCIGLMAAIGTFIAGGGWVAPATTAQFLLGPLAGGTAGAGAFAIPTLETILGTSAPVGTGTVLAPVAAPAAGILTPTNIALAGIGVGVAGQIASSVKQGQVAELNARAEGLKKAFAQDAADRKGQVVRMRHSLLTAQNRAAQSAVGGDITKGSALAVERREDFIAAMEFEQIQANAEIEAFGFDAAAADFRAQGGLAISGGIFNTAGTIVRGGDSLLRNRRRASGSFIT